MKELVLLVYPDAGEGFAAIALGPEIIMGPTISAPTLDQLLSNIFAAIDRYYTPDLEPPEIVTLKFKLHQRIDKQPPRD